MKPLAADLFCGLGGWTSGLMENYRVVGFDIERHAYGEQRYPAQLVLQDALTIHGSQLKDASVIVASPPCQKYSYLAMPWSRSKCPLCKGKKAYYAWQLTPERPPESADVRTWGEPIPCDCIENSRKSKELRADWEKNGPDNRLFDACFRIQREAIEATCACGTGEDSPCGPCSSGWHCCECGYRYIPLIVENVRGAVPWVGPAAAQFGSFYLWGDVAQIGKRVVAGRELADIRAGRGRFGMGVATEKALKGHGSMWFGIQNNGDRYDQSEVNPVSGANKVPGFRFDGSGRSFQTASVLQSMEVLERGGSVTGVKVPGQIQGKEYAMCRTGASGQKVLGYSDPRRNGGKGVHLTSPAENEAGTKIGGAWFSDPNSTCRKHGSRSNARKAASAMIAMVPYKLSRYIAEVHYPHDGTITE